MVFIMKSRTTTVLDAKIKEELKNESKKRGISLNKFVIELLKNTVNEKKKGSDKDD